MQTKYCPRRGLCASTLVVTVVICAILCISVLSYLSLIDQQSRLSTRSQAWNMAIALVEAGVEEGMEHLNSNRTNLAMDGWTYDGTFYTRSNTLTGGNAYVVSVDVDSSSLRPIIVSRAYINNVTLAQNQGPSLFACNAYAGPATITRAVRVQCTRGGLFLASMVARGPIDLNGNGVQTDSFDSDDPSASTNGQYDPAKAKDNGDVATNEGILNALGIGNANIYGHAHTGAGGGAVLGPGGGIGSRLWQSTYSGIQPGWLTQDANFTFPETSMPNYSTYLTPPSGNVVETTYTYTSNAVTSSTVPWPIPWTGVTTNLVSWATVSSYPAPPIPQFLVTNTVYVKDKGYPAQGTYLPPITSTNGINFNYNEITGYSYPQYSYSYYNIITNTIYTTNFYDHILNSGNYVATSLTGKTLIRGQAVLALPNGLAMSGNDSITIAKTGKVTVYSGGNSCTIGGNGVINQPGRAANFLLFCTPSVTSFDLNGNGSFTGVLVAPNAEIAMNGGGNSLTDFVGALMINTVKMNGHFHFHYDEALGRIIGNGRFLISSWDEIP